MPGQLNQAPVTAVCTLAPRLMEVRWGVEGVVLLGTRSGLVVELESKS